MGYICSLIVFVCFSAVVLFINMCYSNHIKNKTLKEMSKMADEAMSDIRNQAEALLNNIAKKYID